jgi:hypothetical protein
MCRRREGRLAEDFINTTFSLVVFARSAVMQQKSLAFIFCRGDAGEFRLAVELNVKSEKRVHKPWYRNSTTHPFFVQPYNAVVIMPVRSQTI